MFPEGRLFEFMIAGVLALVFIGPKDLPMALRKLGQFMARVRSMAAEFRASFDEMARQSELDELRKEVEAMRQAQVSDIAALSGSPEVTQTFDELSQGLTDVGVQLNAPVSYPAVAQTETLAEPAPAAKRARARKTASAKTATAKKTPAKPPAPKTGASARPKPKSAKASAKPTPTVSGAPRARKKDGTVT